MKRPIAVFFALLALTGPFLALPALAQDSGDEVAFTPFLVSFVPMVSLPLGYYDVAISAAGIGAVVRDSYGLMAAGIFNISRDARGLQGAGIFNIARDVRGSQFAGIFNVSGDLRGAQIAAGFNSAKDVRGFQGANGANFAKDVQGVQLAYGANFAEDLKGAQLAYGLNAARSVEGVQVGLVNVADEVDGLQIGLINIARDGVSGLGLVYEPDTGIAQAYWQNGTRALYTVLSAAVPAEEAMVSTGNLVAGLGLGTRIGGRHLSPYVDLEVLAMVPAAPAWNALAQSGWNWDNPVPAYAGPCWPELRLRLGIPLGHLVQLVGGFSLDVEFASAPGLPQAYRQGWSWSDALFGESYTAYGRWFLGLKI